MSRPSVRPHGKKVSFQQMAEAQPGRVTNCSLCLRWMRDLEKRASQATYEHVIVHYINVKPTPPDEGSLAKGSVLC